MKFSCTKKVLDKVSKFRPVEADKEEVSLYNWYVDLINLERKNYFLFTNSKTLFSFILYMGSRKQLEQFETLFELKLEEQIIREVGSDEQLIEKAIPNSAHYTFHKTNNRSVLGSMNDFKNQISVQLWHKGPLEKAYDLINHLINEVPMSGIDMQYPVDAMRKALEEAVSE